VVVSLVTFCVLLIAAHSFCLAGHLDVCLLTCVMYPLQVGVRDFSQSRRKTPPPFLAGFVGVVVCV